MAYRCGKCGNEVSDDTSFCPKCGTKIDKTTPALGCVGILVLGAIYLVVEGPDVEQPRLERPRFGGPMQPQAPLGLFDLHGIGFTKTDNCPVPLVPEVTITVDGQKLQLPETPIRSTEANGYTEENRYQTYARMTDSSVISATASPDVDINVGKIADGRATVTFTYRGQKKIYLIN